MEELNLKRFSLLLAASLLLTGCQFLPGAAETDATNTSENAVDETNEMTREDFSGYWGNDEYQFTIIDSVFYIQDLESEYVNSFDISSEEINENSLTVHLGGLHQDDTISLLNSENNALTIERIDDSVILSDPELETTKFNTFSDEEINERFELFIDSKGEYGVKPYQGVDLRFEDFTGYFANYDKFHASDGVYSELGTYYFSIQDGFFESGWIGSSYMMSHILDYEINGNTMTYRTRRFLYEDNGYYSEEETDPKQNTIEVFKITLYEEEDQDRAILHSSGTIFKRVTDQELSLHGLDTKYEENVASTLSNLAYMNRFKDQLSTEVREVFDLETDAEIKNYPYSIGDLSEVQLYKEHQIIKGEASHPEQDIDINDAISTFSSNNYDKTSSLFETGVSDLNYVFSPTFETPMLTIGHGRRTYWSSTPLAFDIENITLEDNIFTVTGRQGEFGSKETLRFYRISDDIIYNENSDGEFIHRFETNTEWNDFHNLPPRTR